MRLELCGFGVAAAAARTAQLVSTVRPDRVLLVGIAGRLDDRVAIGAARRFTRVACDGIGAGSGDAFIPAGAMGWHHWRDEPGDSATTSGDEIDCGDASAAGPGPLLLTVCAASADAADVRRRRHRFPEAIAEDMEGFAVALGCRLQRIPCDVVGGISNTAGDRDRENWRVTAALEAAADLALQLVAADA